MVNDMTNQRKEGVTGIGKRGFNQLHTKFKGSLRTEKR